MNETIKPTVLPQEITLQEIKNEATRFIQAAGTQHYRPSYQDLVAALVNIEYIAGMLLAARRASDGDELAEALEAFMEPMRRYTQHRTWLKGDENMLIAAYRQAIDVLARHAAQPTARETEAKQ